MRAVALLVGLVVLFIDDDQAKIRIGQEQRRARAHHHRRLARRYRGPIALPRARRQLGMPFQRAHAKTLREAVEKLSGQRDLRHQDQRLFAAADDFGDRLEIDFGFAGARDAVEQGYMERTIGRERAHGINGRTLLRRKLRLLKGRIGRGRRQRRRHRLYRQRALVDEAVDHARADAGLSCRFGLAVQQTVRQHVDQPPARRRQASWRLADQPHAEAHPLGPEIIAHPQRHAQHHAARGQRVVCNPVDQAAQFLLQRRHIELFADILQAVVQARIGIGIFRPHHRDHLARTKRHADDIAGLQLHAARHAIGIILIERDRDQHVDDARRGCRGTGLASGVVHQGIRLFDIQNEASAGRSS